MATQPLPRADRPDSILVEAAEARVTLRNALATLTIPRLRRLELAMRPAYFARRDHREAAVNIGAATFYRGHHTVFQHAHFEFGLENISRQFAWSFLHAHPFTTPSNRASAMLG